MIKITYDAKTTLPLDQLIAFQGEAKTISQENMDKLRRSIKRHGFFVPIFVWQKTPKSRVYILDGHERVAVLQQMRDEGEEIPPLPVEYITAKSRADAAEKLLAITSQFGEFNEEGLLRFAEENRIILEDLDIRLVDTEFVIAEEPEDTTSDDEIPEDVEAVTKPGDLYLFGEHRLLCGDATSEEDVARMMSGEAGDMVLTDPPYSVGYERSQKDRGGSKTVHAAYIDGAEKNILSFLGIVPSDFLVMTYPVDRHFVELSKALKEAKFKLMKELVWVKDTASFWPGSKYQQRHEPILICSRKSSLRSKHVAANDTTVFEIDRPKKHKIHPTLKPVELWLHLLCNHTDKHDIVVDPFVGGGTTVICCEKAGRRCYAIEKVPHYCDVTVQRYCDWCRANGRECVVERIPAGAVE